MLTPAANASPTPLDDDLAEQVGRELDPVEPGHVEIVIDAVQQLPGHGRLLRPGCAQWFPPSNQ